MKFITNYFDHLPYDKEAYIDYLYEERNESLWQGVSIQLKNKHTKIVFDEYSKLVSNLLSKLDLGKTWFVNHDDKDLSWFPDSNKNLKILRGLFREHRIKDTATGALYFSSTELINNLHDLLRYPSILSYKNLDISSYEKPFIIKISSHLHVDFLSTDKELLCKILTNVLLEKFNIIQYRGTVL